MAEHDRDLFLTRASQLLDENSEYLDAATQSALRQARSRALERMDGDRSWLYWGPAGAVAAGFLLFGIYVNQLPPPLPNIYQEPVQLEIAENMELLEDLEFVAWLVMEEST